MTKNKKILHLCPNDIKFIPPFIEFTKDSFDFSRHSFIITARRNDQIEIKNATYIESFTQAIFLFIEMNKAEKIILHSIIYKKIVFLLALQPWLLSKCYWVMWGADLYYHDTRKKDLKNNLYEKIRAFVIKRIGNFITHIQGDYELAQKYYSVKGNLHDCIMYISNIYKEVDMHIPSHEEICILTGNSASPSNNHAEILERLIPYKDKAIKIFCPLSYGNKEYAKKIHSLGKNIFGEKFIPLYEFLQEQEYLKFLTTIDVGIFNYNRQQGIGNINTLIGMGKKVFLKKNTTSWNTLINDGITVYDIDQINITPIDEAVALKNISIIKNIYSKENLKIQLTHIWGISS